EGTVMRRDSTHRGRSAIACAEASAGRSQLLASMGTAPLSPTGPCAATITDSLVGHYSPTPPRRIIALTWKAAEQVLELGIMPLAVADADNYREWVVRPELPVSVPSAGTRLEPNLELLVELKPDLILISPVLADMQAQLARIAPVLQFDAYRHDHDNAAIARRTFLELGKLLDRAR